MILHYFLWVRPHLEYKQMGVFSETSLEKTSLGKETSWDGEKEKK